MKYSDWQLNRIRNSLRAYHCYERSHDGSYFTWNDVQEAIDEYTGVCVPAERLRQFVEGVNANNNGKNGVRKFPVPKDQSIDAIVEFELDEDIDLLTFDELREDIPQSQGLLRLLEYLDHNSDANRLVPPDGIQGIFQARCDCEDVFSVRELTLQRPEDCGLIQVIETEKFYSKIAASKYEGWTDIEREKKCQSHVKHVGWAILTPEDNLLLFLKNQRNGKNRYYFALAADTDVWSECAMDNLILLHHDFPFEYSQSENDFDPESLPELVATETMDKIMQFNRVV